MDGEGTQRIKLRYRLLAGIGIPFIGMLCVVPMLSPDAIWLIWAYPTGLGYLFFRESPVLSQYLGYFILLPLMLATILMPKKVPFWALCSILVICCAFTTAGCRKLNDDLGALIDDVLINGEIKDSDSQ